MQHLMVVLWATSAIVFLSSKADCEGLSHHLMIDVCRDWGLRKPDRGGQR